MVRRRRQGAATDFLDLVAMLPWWGGVGLALASHVLLDRLSAPVSTPMQVGQMAPFVRQALIAGFASIGRWLVPLLCLVGAGVSFVRHRRRRSLVGAVTGSTGSDAAAALDGMSWREFELLVGESFRQRGWQVTHQGGAQADGGVDLVLRKDGETFVVQCKQWRAFKVGVGVVRDLYGVMAARGAAGGFVVTSGTFTTEARKFAEGRNVTLMEGPALLAMLRQARTASAPIPSVVPAPSPSPSPTEPQPGGDAPMPACPTCRSVMVRRTARTARTGVRAGTAFWGCSRFPSCRGTR